jgi:hypothetical protein
MTTLTTSKSKTQLKLEYLEALEKKKAMRDGLPFLYAWKWYKWAWDFYNSTNRKNVLCSANQISKTASMIRRCINNATNPEVWFKFWDHKPTTFAYYMPSKDLMTMEFDEKWIKEFLPRGEFKTHPQYGWEEDRKQKTVHSIKFNTGVTVYFRSYEQTSETLQASSYDEIFVDEECPTEILDELLVRLIARNGIANFAFTATTGQEFWRCVVEERGQFELWKDAFKQQISMYDCMKYMDGSLSPWTLERIKQIEKNCSSEAEIQRRVMGRFVVDEGKTYHAFSRSKNLKPDHMLPKDWLIYSAVDCGGGLKSHPAAICFLGVSPDFTKGRVFKSWRGDKVETTAGDVYRKYVELRGNMKPALQIYDWENKDFKLITTRLGEPFIPADKSRESGIELVNTLFKNEMLAFYETPDNMKIVNEVENLRKATKKTHAKDDGIDCVRYACQPIPWDFSKSLTEAEEKIIASNEKTINERERFYKGLDKPKDSDGLDLLEAEYEEANEAYDYGAWRDE